MECEKRKSIWGLRTFVVITGASRGIGKTIAIKFAQQIHENSTMLLLARSVSDLKKTKHEILSIRPNIDVEISSIDLSKPDEQLYWQTLMKAAKNLSFDLYLLVHNAGTTIVDTPAAEMSDVNRWNEYMTINLYSETMLTSVFLKLFNACEKICIINMSSLCAHQASKGLAMYSAAKAARELYFKVLAVENPSVNVLNYSPGPVETDMYKATAAQSCFADVIESFSNRMKTDGCVKVEDTVDKLIFTLREQNYKNGGTIDFFGRI